MAIDTRSIETLEDAESLLGLVYGAYGLTYHRSFMYDAEQLLRLNQERSLISMLAIDRDSGEVVGHQALIRPWFEASASLPAGGRNEILEVGLSIVHPDWQSQGIQNTLALALLMHVTEHNPSFRGAFMKCLANQERSQKSARRFLGRVTCLFPAGVPAWVVCEGDTSTPAEPLSTVMLYCPYGEKKHATVPVPARHEEFFRTIYAAADLPRDLRPVRAARPARRKTEVATWFDPARRQGLVRLVQPGRGLAQAVAERVQWMRDGHIEHITVLLPLDSDQVAAAVEELEAEGLFLGGVIPNLEGTDTLVLQWASSTSLDTSKLQVLGEEGEYLLEYVLNEWESSRAERLKAS